MLMRMPPHGYALGKCIHRTSRSTLYEGTRIEDGIAVVFKQYAADRNLDREPRVLREFDAMQRSAAPGVPQAFGTDRSGDIPLLIEERVPGIPLAALIEQGPLSVELWLSLAVQLSETLDQIHGAGLLHRQITPSNILVHRESGRAWIIDFGRASTLGSSEGDFVEEASLRWLWYIAPEQTGRMNRGCDFRSDLYSLGATLYHALAGLRPFESKDTLELIHAHMARIPGCPSEAHPDLPSVLCKLVLKLLRKEPADRYQSAKALHTDLVLCRDQLETSGSVAADLELSDLPSRPTFSSRLHGREAEIAQLISLYKQASHGASQFLLLSGDPGVGKTTLIDSLRSEVARRGAYLTGGKFDRDRGQAYAGWVGALDALVQQLLLESDADIERWRTDLQAGMGNIAQALIDVIPDMAFILQDVPAIPSLGPSETLARLSLALQRFVGVVARPNRPLVLVLDDLQWIDAGSPVLLEDLVRNSGSTSLLLIGTYRENEVDGNHPITAFKTRLDRDRIERHSMLLAPLTREAVTQMLAEALLCDADQVEELCEIVAERTANVPLLVQQFIDYLYEQGCMHHERSAGWSWDPEALRASGIPEDSVGLMTAKIARLDANPREVLRFASCVGNSFDIELLARLSNQPLSELEPPLRELARESLIIPAARGFRFTHDRIREAARMDLSNRERAELHYQMASVLLESDSTHGSPVRPIDIADHLNQAPGLIPDEMRLTHIHLNLEAGRSLLAAGAGALAGRYLEVALQSLRPSDWTENWALTFDVHLQNAESAFQRGDVDSVFTLLDALEAHTLSTLEFLQVVIKRIQTLALKESPEECARYVLKMLRKLGIRWPLRPSWTRARFAILIVRLMMRGRKRAAITRAADFKIDRFAPLLILAPSGAVFLRVDLSLAVLASCTAMRRYIRWGYVGRPGFSVAVFGVFSYLMAPNVKRARLDEAAARYWNDQVPDPVYEPRAQLLLSAALHPWLMPRREALAPLDRISEQAREVGDPEFAYYARFLKVTCEALAGAHVVRTERALGELAETVRRAGHWYPEPGLVHRAYRLLLSEQETAQIDAILGELEADVGIAKGSAAPYMRTFCMLIRSVQSRFELAWAQSEALGGRLERVVPFVHVADHTFMRGLAAAELATRSRARERRRYQRALRTAKQNLRSWSRRGPDFVHMYTLLEAETARLGTKIARARELYGRAATRAEPSSRGSSIMLHWLTNVAVRCSTHRAGRSRLRESDRERSPSTLAGAPCSRYENSRRRCDRQRPKTSKIPRTPIDCSTGP